MFDSKQTLTERLSDAFDLMIDFATLGEYGLEPVGRASRACEVDRRRIASPRRGSRSSRPLTTTSRPEGRLKSYEEPAATYSPRGLPPKYHRR